ncbi:hypothetical protein [Mycobacterium sp. Aquia_213]|uniref:hypothetical protein n=1 Tax=Mycobacterium sp. Aquia_213 TaxID=2991728 RepID=UPI00227026BB|nr:hypothetical protein [Mycobacterium sp. Aquia_213]WAC91774.1 hypothetical protein LMQ14_00630 [Mycobacterium sp. Aquia_213]
MRRLRIVLAIVLALFVFTSGNVANAVVEQDVVASLSTTNPNVPVGVAFGRHAAIYQLARDDPNFTAWLAILQRSLTNGTPVRFDYDVVGPRLTLVEPAQ